MAEESAIPADAPKRFSSKLVIVLLVAAVFAGVVLAKVMNPAAESVSSGGASITTVHNDAMADYDAALKTGKPIYLLFHSLS